MTADDMLQHFGSISLLIFVAELVFVHYVRGMERLIPSALLHAAMLLTALVALRELSIAALIDIVDSRQVFGLVGAIFAVFLGIEIAAEWVIRDLPRVSGGPTSG